MKIKVLLVIPGKEVQTVKIPASIKFIKAFIGKELYRIKLNEHTVLIANRNARLDEFNRFLEGNIILGTFLIVSIKNKHRVSMKKKDIRTFSNMFKLRKHQRKIDIYKNEYLTQYYLNQRKIQERNAENNKREIFEIAA